jgi:hypothetical protein
LHWLLNVWEVPEELKEYGDGKNATRFGFREYHAPIIRDELWEDSPAAKLLALIDTAVFTRGSSFPSEGDDAPGAMKLWDMVGDKETGHDEQGMKVRLWHGKAETLELLLTGEGGWHCSVVTLAKSLFRACKCSRLLGSLHDNEAYKDVRISKRDTRNWKGWLIAPPSV